MVFMPTNNYISVVDKAMRVLEALRGKGEVPLGEIASSAGLIKSSTFRILFTFERLGYVQKSTGGRYELTAQLARLTSDHRPSPDLGNLAEPFLAELLGRFQETVNLGVLDDGEVLFIRVQESSHSFRLANHAGMRTPVHSTALGKCLLCCLPRKEIETILKNHPLRVRTSRTVRDRPTFYREIAGVRSRGYAIDNQEYSRGARCVAAPIYTPAGDVCAAISVAGPAARMIPQRDREIAEALMETCGKITRLVGYTTSAQKGPSREAY
jgi:DNA-binding IclR family transcriptional regulator